MTDKRIKWTSESVLEKALEVHDRFYDYDLNGFKNLQSKIKVICPKHGHFSPSAKNHLNGSGCPVCFRERTSEKQKGIKRPNIGGRKGWTKEKFVEKAHEVHGDKYDYTDTVYINAHEKVEILCPEHGVFEQRANSHLKGYGCLACASKRKPIDHVLSSFKKAHGTRYNYSKVNYQDARTSIEIVCSEHGSFFQRPTDHMRGQGCPKCTRNAKKTQDEVIKQFEKVHGNRYDYSKVHFIDTKTKVAIICPEHGEFEQIPNSHALGRGCDQCGGTADRDQESVVDHFETVHGNKYDYSKFEYSGRKIKSVIICNEHGEFEQTPDTHIRGRGCPKCKADKHRNTHDKVIESFSLAHGDRYDYSKVKYVTAEQKVIISCKEHGEFKQTPAGHRKGQGCPICSCITSKGEIEVYDFIVSLIGKDNVIQRDRSIIPPYELDIVIPGYKLAIEYCGLYWHSSSGGKSRNYHLEKHIKTEQAGYRLITIFEDEWRDKQHIVKDTLKHFLGKSEKGVYARKTEIREISWAEAKRFLEDRHLLGPGQAGTYRIGAFHNDELISVMVFGSPSDERGKRTDVVEMKRFVTNGKNNPGVGSKMFKYAIEQKGYPTIIAFVDRRWFTGTFKSHSGFVVEGETQPTKYWTDYINRYQRRFKTKKSMLKSGEATDPSLTKEEMLGKLGFYPIYDCGKLRLIWRIQ
jgi:hypothetical protein